MMLKRNKLSIKEVVTLIFSTTVILLFAYPAMLSYDIFNYIATAKLLFFYHENPYIIMPIEFAGDPLLLFVHAANKTALYGPFWILLTGVPYFLGFGNFLVTLFNFKLFIAIFYLASSWLVYKLSNNIKSVVLFSLNPLVIIESLVSGHNDIVMMVFVLASLYLAKKKLIGIVLYLFSVLIKYSTIFLFPVYVFIVMKKSFSKKIYLYASILMFLIFLLSPLREELYPWYAIWFLPLLYIFTNKGPLVLLTNLLCFGLLLSYLPFMYSGTYFGLTPLIKYLFVSVPVGLTFLFITINKLVWQKSSNRF